MEKIPYKDFNLKINEDYNTFTFQDKEIKVLKYLPIDSKYDLIMITLQEAETDGYYNELKTELFFALNLVYLYTNVEFTDDEKSMPAELYDNLKSSGFLDKFYATIDPDEYHEVLGYMEHIRGQMENAKNSIYGTINEFMTRLPQYAEQTADIVKAFNPEDFKQVIDMARAAGYQG